TISLLLNKGASAAIKNNGGWTPLDFAYSDMVTAHMEDCLRSLGRPSTSTPPSFSSLYNSGQEGTPMPTSLAASGRKESWTSLSNGPLSPILATISGATSPRLMPSNAWSEFKRVV
ncbi:hypothetical protein BGW38_008807, partial [Lunasporangiospora selenospora]